MIVNAQIKIGNLTSNHVVKIYGTPSTIDDLKISIKNELIYNPVYTMKEDWINLKNISELGKRNISYWLELNPRVGTQSGTVSNGL